MGCSASRRKKIKRKSSFLHFSAFELLGKRAENLWIRYEGGEMEPRLQIDMSDFLSAELRSIASFT